MVFRLDNVQRLHALLTVLVACAALMTGRLSSFGVLLGGTVMGLDFWAIRKILTQFVLRDSFRKTSIALCALGLKFVLFLGVVTILFLNLPVDALSFAVGVSALPLACVVEALRARAVHS